MRDDNTQGLFISQRIGVTIFRSNFHTHRDASQLFNIVLCYQACMVGRTTSDDENFIEASHHVRSPVQLIKDHRFFIFCNMGAESIANSLRLIVNFLEHEVLITALFRCFCIPSNMEYILIDRIASPICNGNAVSGDNSYLIIC